MRTEAPVNRGNSRPGFNTTRPDFGVNRNFGSDFNSRDQMTRRPGLTTRPDFNGRSNFDSRGNNNRNGNVRSDLARSDRPSFATRPEDRRGNDGRHFNDGNRFNDGRRNDFNRSRDGHFNGRPGWHDGRGRHWHGGYWNGRFWPRVYYRPNFIGFYSYLPGTYSTFWWGGTSYYYVDDLYYTWSPARYGYVVTDPPPYVDNGTAVTETSDSAAIESSESSGGSANVYVYPRNGQTEEQTSQDRYDCHQWAVSQTGFDPTMASTDVSSAGTGSADYRRALVACLDARGYSAN
jgi:hypothetical protein